MASRLVRWTTAGCSLALSVGATGAASAFRQEAARAPVMFASARVSIAGTSNVHAYTATTTDVRVVRARFMETVSGPADWDRLVKPGALDTFEIAVSAKSLSSDKDGLDKNMHKALKVDDHPEITFRLTRLGASGSGAVEAAGVLRVAGVEREVTFGLRTSRQGANLAVKGELPLLMTDYGIKPPKAMLGMLKTDPRVTVTFEVTLAMPLT